jgi:hypothetical protein
MLILFDQATPVPLRPFLTGHSVRTAAEQGWDRLRNGDLITAAENAGFDMVLTTDKNMQFQQNIANRRIAVIILGRRQWPELRPHVELVIGAVGSAKPGTFTVVEIP